MAEDTGECGPVVSIDIDDTVQLLLKNDEEVRNSSDHSSGFIFMVPKVYRDLSPSSFTPRVVSIGPLHHKDEHLKAFEVQKATYMHNLLHNILSPLDSTPEQILKECVSKVSGSVDRIKARYFGMQPYPDSELVPMMVTDACFILSFLYKPYVYKYSSLGPIDLLHGHIVLDMILIENQIPFFVLQNIFECTFQKLRPTRPLAKYISLILECCNIFKRDLAEDSKAA